MAVYSPCCSRDELSSTVKTWWKMLGVVKVVLETIRHHSVDVTFLKEKKKRISRTTKEKNNARLRPLSVSK